MIQWTFVAVAGLNFLSGVLFYLVALYNLFAVVLGYWTAGDEGSATDAERWAVHLYFTWYMGAGSLFFAIAAFVYHFGVRPI